MTWRDDALCHDEPLDVMFGDRDTQREAAIRLCKHCPVKQRCHEEGRRQPYGLWGGIPEGYKGRPKIGGDAYQPTFHDPSRSPVRSCKCSWCDDARQRAEAVRAHRRKPAVHPDVEPILTVCAAEAGLEVADLVGRSRSRRVVAARQRAMALLRDVGLSFPEIGRVLDRDHSSVMHGVRRYQEKEAA